MLATLRPLDVAAGALLCRAPRRPPAAPSTMTRRQRHGRYGPSKVLPSAQQVTAALRANERFFESNGGGAVKGIDWNQLPSNSPLEDTLAIAAMPDQQSYLVSVFDGHGGVQCARALARRLPSYVAAGLAGAAAPWPLAQLTPQDQQQPPPVQLQRLLELQFQQFRASVEHLHDDPDRVRLALEAAFEALDHQIGEEALAFLIGPDMAQVMGETPRWDWEPWWREQRWRSEDLLRLSTLSTALSGAVTCAVHVSAAHLVVASTGDCQAVLGSASDDGGWTARKLTHEHTAENTNEVERIYGEHPASERDTILRMDRLLGQLMPLRAFGDFRFKWPRRVLQNWVGPLLGDPSPTPPNYKTPPYLTARPEVTRHALQPRDKFLVVASDGLWDFLSPTQVVHLVGEHMSGREALGPLEFPAGDVTIGRISALLQQRREDLSRRPLDANAATHLIRHALGCGDAGLDPLRLAELLSLPKDVARLFRDDITIAVVYFDDDVSQRALP